MDRDCDGLSGLFFVLFFLPQREAVGLAEATEYDRH